MVQGQRYYTDKNNELQEYHISEELRESKFWRLARRLLFEWFEFHERDPATERRVKIDREVREQLSSLMDTFDVTEASRDLVMKEIRKEWEEQQGQ